MREETRTSEKVTARQLMEDMPKAFHPERATGEQAIIQYRLSGEGGGDWYLIVDNGKVTVHEGVNPDAGVTLNMAASDFVDLGTGKLDGMTAFVGGKIKAQGNLGLALKVQNWFAP